MSLLMSLKPGKDFLLRQVSVRDIKSLSLPGGWPRPQHVRPVWHPRPALVCPDEGHAWHCGLVGTRPRPLRVEKNMLMLKHCFLLTYKDLQIIAGTVNSLLKDTSIRRTTGVGPCRPFFSHFTVSKLSRSRRSL